MNKISNVNSNEKRGRQMGSRQTPLLETTPRNLRETFYKEVIPHSTDAVITNMRELSNTAPIT